MIDGPARDLDEGSSPVSWPARAASGPSDHHLPDVTADAETGPSTRRRAAARGPRGAGSLLRETAIILVSAVVLSLLVKTFLVQAFFIPSQSMHDTLVEDDRILVSKLTPGPFDLRRGDIVVFRDPGGWLLSGAAPELSPVREAINSALTFIGLYPADANEHLVKRLIGLPGDRVACAGAGEPITINDEPIDEPYLAAGVQPSEIAFDITVPPDSLWVMGDNRPQSSDSRRNQGNPGGGSVPIANVVGMAFVTVWPIQRAGLLHNPTGTFSDVPDQP
ncbi:signal peptidase I [Cellulomonas sp. Leaf334]|uniref:signal peptidase I n=1 Tax=Cellulomonas sp. Leaf334 TaxID=1736339 RepID=UPI000AEF1C45|nr:signal peptidase I [Cellulomonas sp. Leaf334]